MLTKPQIILQSTLQMMSLGYIKAFKALDAWAFRTETESTWSLLND